MKTRKKKQKNENYTHENYKNFIKNIKKQIMQKTKTPDKLQHDEHDIKTATKQTC